MLPMLPIMGIILKLLLSTKRIIKFLKMYSIMLLYQLVIFQFHSFPEYPGMKAFPGRIMHSHDFRDAEEFRDKNVIVLGSSYSAEDVALQCHKYGAKSVTIGYRHNPMGFKWPKWNERSFSFR